MELSKLIFSWDPHALNHTNTFCQAGFPCPQFGFNKLPNYMLNLIIEGGEQLKRNQTNKNYENINNTKQNGENVPIW